MNVRTYFEEIGIWPKDNVLISYVMGFILSLVCTVLAYMLATSSVLLFSFSVPIAVSLIVILAVIQLVVQLSFFLHLSARTTSRDRYLIFCATMFIVAVLFIGSVWIMNTLNTRMMPDTTKMNAYMKSQSGL